MLDRHVPLTARLMARQYRAGRAAGPMPYYLDRKYQAAIVDTKALAIDEQIDLAAIQDPEILSRALSVELLLKHL